MGGKGCGCWGPQPPRREPVLGTGGVAVARVHLRPSGQGGGYNTPGLIPAPTVTASSEGGNNSKVSPQSATSEGEKSSIETEVPSIWYDQPREKRRKVSTGNTKPPRRSRRFTKEQNERFDVVDEAVSEQFMEEKTNFGLGLTPKRVT